MNDKQRIQFINEMHCLLNSECLNCKLYPFVGHTDDCYNHPDYDTGCQKCGYFASFGHRDTCCEFKRGETKEFQRNAELIKVSENKYYVRWEEDGGGFNKRKFEDYIDNYKMSKIYLNTFKL